jgi:lysozyme
MIDSVIDVSHFDGSPDWTKVRSAGIQGVIHKATQGKTYVDPTFATARQTVPAAGFLWGAYHFGTGDEPGKEQAQFFLDTVKPDAQTVCAIDFETNPTGTQMTLPEMLDWINTVEQATGRWPLVYGGKSLLFTDIASTPEPTLAKCPLWIAQYTTAPAPSNIPPQVWQTWTLWQYTETGTVDGITVDVDRERFNGTADELTAWWTGMAAS